MSLSREQLFFITVRARPSENAENCADVDCAYINCWVDAVTEEDAIARAQSEVGQVEWIWEGIESVSLVTRETYEKSGPGREYFEQALLDGITLVFHTWPNEPQEDEGIH